MNEVVDDNAVLHKNKGAPRFFEILRHEIQDYLLLCSMIMGIILKDHYIESFLQTNLT
jgi:hypothetical protein